MTPDQLRKAVARLYIDKWGVSDYGLADAAIAIVVEEMARVAEQMLGSYTTMDNIPAAIRAYGRKDDVSLFDVAKTTTP